MLKWINFSVEKSIYLQELVTELLNTIDSLYAQQPSEKVKQLEKTIVNLKTSLKQVFEEKIDLQMRLEAMTNTQRLHYDTIGFCADENTSLNYKIKTLTEANELLLRRVRDVEDSNQFLRNNIKKYHAIEQALKKEADFFLNPKGIMIEDYQKGLFMGNNY